ncbi:NAD(P)/FAD-dependent oxidoreductase [Nesterenkonia sp. LB17]|uniref:phytoene desaturase family protein n=1 Tax=unclassified Nesterenkonia TaxID=2629769 RepID=UPI001F4D2F97|nr:MULTISPECIES: NAD(P)/FAD-dependent oxidoreductase [unclassified Nesterenkonia]MCH8560815.1 NAD(P)/FAD-dependent oxidoreductase [Nesterenkonia sp. DZ6]MCH8566226.1 NAD(P)/FAD-dependent oxidoreductase [Nesterenkonia sp. LB17]MCH8570895.1 NAD(P)/FAD-dependent oxidoreductase [Nesterenkonia sp. AY15]
MKRAAVVGSGPNGLTAACLLAQAGWEVTVYEAAAAPGGAMRSAELFAGELGGAVPGGEGVISDLGASVFPFGPPPVPGVMRHGLEYVHASIPAAHGLDDGAPPALLETSVRATAAGLGPDGAAWTRVFGPVARDWDQVLRAGMTPITAPWTNLQSDSAARRLQSLLQIGARGAWPSTWLQQIFAEAPAKALFAGLAGHATTDLRRPLTSAFGLLLGTAAQVTGWPMARGGSGAVVRALVAELESHGGTVVTGRRILGLEDLREPGSTGPGGHVPDAVLLDLTPRQLRSFSGLRLPRGYSRALSSWNYGTGIVKIDYLLEGPIPWRHESMGRASTVHLGGGASQMAASEAAAVRGTLPGRPYVLLTQPAAADPSRTPDERTVAWAYAHVPGGLSGSAVPRAAKMIEAEIEAQAPGFGASVQARKLWSPADLQEWNPNLVGGSISAGAPTLRQFLARPVLRADPYRVPQAGGEAPGTPGLARSGGPGPEVYLCSASTPPGGGAHGMAGFHAAQSVLRRH